MKDPDFERPQPLDVLSVGPLGVTSHGEVERAREQMLPWLEEQVAAVPLQRRYEQKRERVRRIARWTGGFAVAALAAAATLALYVRGAGSNDWGKVATESSSRPAPDTARLVTGKLSSPTGSWSFGERVVLSGRMEAGAEGAALQDDRGYQLELRPTTAISFESDAKGSPRQAGFRLHHGVAKVSVLPLPRGSELTIKTGDVLLTVIQSAFTVEAREGQPSCVRVSEGKVQIRRGADEVVVSAGDSFGCAKALAVETSVVEGPKKSASGPRTTLTQENALLSRALAAESRGDAVQARRAYGELLSKYPRSAFAQDAQAGLERLGR